MLSTKTMRFTTKKRLIPVIALLLAIIGCSENPTNSVGEANVLREDGKIFIVDRTGKRWDVTQAEKKYGMKAAEFQFGLGPFAITPINNPSFWLPGESGYPDPNGNFLVIGTEIGGDTRAYPIDVLSRHEIANEKFNRTFVAVGY